MQSLVLFACSAVSAMHDWLATLLLVLNNVRSDHVTMNSCQGWFCDFSRILLYLGSSFVAPRANTSRLNFLLDPEEELLAKDPEEELLL